MTLDRRDPAYHTSLVRCSSVGGVGVGVWIGAMLIVKTVNV